jgi:hypothetical protein
VDYRLRIRRWLRAFRVAVDSGVLDKDHINLASALFSSNQIVY